MEDPTRQLLKNPDGRRAAVVGAGVSGQSAARLLQKLGAEVTIFDEKVAQRMSPGFVMPAQAGIQGTAKFAAKVSSVKEQCVARDASLRWHDNKIITETDLLDYELIVLSPGFPRSKPAIAAAIAKRIPIVNEIDLAAVHLPGCRFIGVTGTNGKSTTTAMIGDILKTRDSTAFIGGNLGRPLCDAVLAGEKPVFGVVELSSYQLETLSMLRLEVAVVTHLTPDHLDRYDDEEHYYRTKSRIFLLLKPDGYALINQKDPNSVKFLQPTQKTIGFNAPVSIAMPRAVGAHNVENAAAAIAATRALGFDQADIEEALNQFAGMPHRLEFLGVVGGVRWFNDSKATNVESAITAMRSFDTGVHLILGGLGKGASYEPLVDVCSGRAKCIYLIGDDAPAIEKAFFGHLPTINAGTLDLAVKEAVKNASNGDVILLSPACASFDQYPNYAARGDHFRSLFHEYQGHHHA